MKLTVLLFFLINTLIDCQPIDNVNDKRSRIDDVGVRISNLNNSERISMPQDVELVEPPRKNQQQQSLIPGFGSLIDMIFAVN